MKTLIRNAVVAGALGSALNRAKSADESNTGALLKFPYITDENHPLYQQEFEVAPAHYGIHDYGGSLEAWLVIPANVSYSRECPKEPAGSNQYIRRIREENAKEEDRKFMLLVDRGDCYFVDKTTAAESLGASGVIVLDYISEYLFNMWEPDNFDDNLNIPSVLLDEEHAETLMSALKVENWNRADMKYPTQPDFPALIGVLEWGLPHDDDRVEYELWTSANDVDSRLFKRHWEKTALYMDYNNYTVYTPHFYLLDGSHWSCDDGSYRCGKQCTNGGRYCSVDPEYDLTIGLDGMDVVQENLRSMCVWQFVKMDQMIHNQSIWWDYSIRWDNICANDTATFTEECSYEQMDKVLNGLSNSVKRCVQESGGYGYEDSVNGMLAAETFLRENVSVYALPTIMVNEYSVQGNIDCDQVTLQDCQVLDAICAGFLEGTAPPQCYVTPTPTPEQCPDSEKDCKGTCFGRYEMDACGKCLLIGDELFDDCLDCNRVPNGGATRDCRQVCGGTYKINTCHMCVDTMVEGWNDTGKNCHGTCDGAWAIDACEKCRSTEDPLWDDCVVDENSGSGDSKDSSSATAAIVISVVAFLLLALAGLGLYRLWNRQREVDQQFNSIMQTYNLMDDKNGQTAQGKAALPVPDEDPEDALDEEG